MKNTISILSILGFLFIGCASMFIKSSNYSNVIPPENDRLIDFIDILNETDLYLRKNAIKRGAKRKIVNENNLLIIFDVASDVRFPPGRNRPHCIPDPDVFLNRRFYSYFNSKGILFDDQNGPIFLVHRQGFYPYRITPNIQKSLFILMKENGYFFYIRRASCRFNIFGIGPNIMDQYSIDSTGLVFLESFNY